MGDLILMSLSAFGLALVAREMGSLFLVVKLAGAALSASASATNTGRRRSPICSSSPSKARQGFLAQLVLTLGNPKAHRLFRGADAHGDRSEPAEWRRAMLQLCAATLVLIPAIELAYAALASQAARLVASKARRRMNKGAGAVMIGAGIGVAVN